MLKNIIALVLKSLKKLINEFMFVGIDIVNVNPSISCECFVEKVTKPIKTSETRAV